MSRHVMALTYAHKIDAVLSDRCKQTIRQVGKRKICIGDVITLHGWEGDPYCKGSTWSWRKEVIVTDVFPADISKDGMFIEGTLYEWDSWYPTRLAEYDYILPAKGEELRDVLFRLHGGVPKEPMKCIIIRW